MAEYKGGHVVRTSNNSRLPIAHISSTVLAPQYNPQKVALQDMYYIPGMKKNLLSISELTSSGHYVLFGPQAVKIYQNLKIIGTPTMEGRKIRLVLCIVSRVHLFRQDSKELYNRFMA